jgi:hypothetical protein
MNKIILSFLLVFLIINLKAQDTDYLIVCPDLLYTSAVQLKDYRESTGYSVSIVNSSTISNGDPLTAELIDSWIENYILSNKELKYIVLLGNINLLPTYFSYYDGFKYDSDLWYSIKNDTLNLDFLPTISVGRIPVSNSVQFSNYLNKIKCFETSLNQTNTILFFGNTAEMSYARGRDIVLAYNLGFDTISLINPNEEELFNVLNTRPLKAIVYYGHGSVYWNYPLGWQTLIDWANTQKPVLYFSGGCSFNDNTLGKTPLGDSLIISPNGSICSVGASINGGYGYEYRFIEGILMKIKIESTIGNLYNSSLKYLYNCSPENSIGSYTYYFTRRMNLIGDPGLKINTQITSISDKETYSLKYFPNPTKEKFYIEGFSKDEEVKISVYNNLGVLCDKFVSSSSSMILDFKSYNKGIYFILFSNQKIRPIKFIKE